MKLQRDRLSIVTSVMRELPQLEMIHQEALDYFSFDPACEIVFPFVVMTQGNLSVDGNKDNYEMLSCYWDNELIGCVQIYRGYPDEDTVYLAYLYLQADKRGQGIGTAAVRMLFSYYADLGYTRVRLAVSLKNIGGLYFWFKCGFAKITKVNGRDDYHCLELEKDLT